MGRIARSVVQSLLKVANSGIGMVGIAMILYALWMFRVCQRQMGPPLPDPSILWFIYSFLGIGVILCVITCSGHIAAETANGCCLCFYIVVVILLVMVEAALAIDVILNRNWEEDFPNDPTGNFDDLKDFVKDNFEICEWIGLVVVAIQGVSILLAMILRALGPHHERYYDSDDDYIPERVPLLKHYVASPCVVADPINASQNDSWNIRINSKVDIYYDLKDVFLWSLDGSPRFNLVDMDEAIKVLCYWLAVSLSPCAKALFCLNWYLAGYFNSVPLSLNVQVVNCHFSFIITN